MARETLIVWLVLIGGSVLGVVTDTLDWPVHNWLVVETLYVAAVALVLGTISDIHRGRRRR